jgi:uncharacterized protein YecE (DUF72 family)
MQSFGTKLGYSFMQLSDKFGPDRAAILQDYVRGLPRDFRTCVELRQEDWFGPSGEIPAAKYGTGHRFLTHRPPGNSFPTHRSIGFTSPVDRSDNGIIADTWQLLRESGIGTVITDSAGRRDCVHMKLTAPVAFIRFVGNNLHPTDYTRINAWAGRLKSWIDQGLREIYFIIHSPDELYAPELALYAVEELNRQCGTSLNPPRLLKDDQSKNLTLF